jgi:hypothetical protein
MPIVHSATSISVYKGIDGVELTATPPHITGTGGRRYQSIGGYDDGIAPPCPFCFPGAVASPSFAESRLVATSNVAGKVVVITGASSGIGESTARLLAAS